MGEIEQLVKDIKEHTPRVRLLQDPERLGAYTVSGVLPLLVATPTTSTDLATVVELTNRHQCTLLSRGGGSRIHFGNVPERIDILIETNKLTRLLEHEAPDLTCRVEAGLTLTNLQKQLRKKGQRLALDPPNGEQATIGGILASNSSGPKRLRYGTARDQVIGLKVVQADGKIAQSGGRVVKNVAGYDLNKLYIGSLGTLGVIVEANFKLQPLPEAERTLLLTYASVVEAMQTVIEIQGSLLTPGSLELIDASAANDLSDFFGQSLPTNGYTLAISFEGNQASIARQMDETRLIGRKQGAFFNEDLNEADQESFWQSVREHTQGTVTCKAAILVSQVAPYIQQIQRICQKHELEASVIAHAGNGVLYIDLRPSDASHRLVLAIHDLRLHAHQARGSLVVESAPADLKRLVNIWGEPGSDFYLMQRLKKQFDPKGTFVSGRFVGGL